MPWTIGIDEAGYGPNLGPLVMTLVAFRVPDAGSVDLWEKNAAAVRRHGEKSDKRILVADSKQCYTPQRGLGQLEKGVVATLLPGLLEQPTATLGDCLSTLAPDCLKLVQQESWYLGETIVPVAAKPEVLREAAAAFREAQAENKQQVIARSVVVCASEFNELLERWDNKSAVLTEGLCRLCRAIVDRDDGEPIHFHVDKHGGRNSYSAILQDAFPEGMVMAREENAQRSVYEVVGFDRPIRLTFQPRADIEHFPVALASMASKYVRELLMKEFNAFWQSRLPGLKPTAGYPVDAARFYRLIRPVAEKLGLSEAKVWRRR